MKHRVGVAAGLLPPSLVIDHCGMAEKRKRVGIFVNREWEFLSTLRLWTGFVVKARERSWLMGGICFSIVSPAFAVPIETRTSE